MKLLVFSDSHGRSGRVRELLMLHHDAGAAVFLGDGLRDLPAAAEWPCPLYTVRGNCDVFTLFDSAMPPEERLLCFSGHQLFVLHGHTRGVKAGYMRAAAAAAERGADLLLFGHTHEPVEAYIPAEEGVLAGAEGRSLYLFNPGALAEGSYGLIELQAGNILLSHGKI